MKKLLLVFAVCLFTVSSYAQTQKGKFMLGGSSNLSFLNIKFDGNDDSLNQFQGSVGIGYFVIDNFAINAGLGYTYQKYGDNDSSDSFAFSVGARYYTPINIFVDADFDIQTTNSTTGTGVTLGAGYAIFLNDKVALEPAVGYRIGLSSKDDGTKYNAFGVNLGFSFYF